jgi:DNA helicase II / ATP-dependent DNA helicase PcrA
LAGRGQPFAEPFASLAEQLCGAVVDFQPNTVRQLERALLHTIQDATGQSHPDIFTHDGRVVLIRLLREAKRLSTSGGALA